MVISKRHERSALRTRVIKRISDIPSDEWNRVFPDILESYDYFRTLDKSNLEQFSFYYIIVYSGKVAVGAAACFLMDYSLDTSIDGPLKRVTNSIRRIAPNFFNVKAVICGIPTGQGRIGVISHTEAVIKAVVRRMEQLAKKNRASVIAFKNFDKHDTKILDSLQNAGFRKFDSLPSTKLSVNFKDFEEYLKTLSGSSRYDLRRKFKKTDKFTAIDLEITDALTEDVLRDAYKLYLNTNSRFGKNFELLSMEFFRNVSGEMPGRVKFFLWRIDGKLAAFLFSMVSKELFMDYYLGLDYSFAYEYNLYFIKFRDTLRWCIEQGMKEYEMGTDCYEPKMRLGFDLVPYYLYVKLLNRALRPAFNLLCMFLRFENFDPTLRNAKRRSAL